MAVNSKMWIEKLFMKLRTTLISGDNKEKSSTNFFFQLESFFLLTFQGEMLEMMSIIRPASRLKHFQLLKENVLWQSSVSVNRDCIKGML